MPTSPDPGRGFVMSGGRMETIHPHPPVPPAVRDLGRTVATATPIPEMERRLATATQPTRRLWTGPQLMARVRNTPDHETVGQANP